MVITLFYRYDFECKVHLKVLLLFPNLCIISQECLSFQAHQICLPNFFFDFIRHKNPSGTLITLMLLLLIVKFSQEFVKKTFR